MSTTKSLPPHIPCMPEKAKLTELYQGSGYTGNRARRIREREGLNLAEFARALRVTTTTTHTWEKNADKPISTNAARKIESLVQEINKVKRALEKCRTVTVYDSGYRLLPTGHVLPESWFRATAARVAERNKGLTQVVFADTTV